MSKLEFFGAYIFRIIGALFSGFTLGLFLLSDWSYEQFGINLPWTQDEFGNVVLFWRIIITGALMILSLWLRHAATEDEGGLWTLGLVGFSSSREKRKESKQERKNIKKGKQGEKLIYKKFIKMRNLFNKGQVFQDV